MAIVDLFAVFCFVLGAMSAVLVAFHPNILYAAVALIFSLLSVAGMYGVLGADFLAAVQLIIYVGGIIIVILFAVMMSANVYQQKQVAPLKSFLFAFFFSILILVALLKLIWAQSWNSLETLVRENTVEQIGRALTGPYALVFQYVAIVLLAGLIGAVVIARPQYGSDSKMKSGEPS